MNCNKARSSFVELLHDETPRPETHRLLEHLAGCAECRAALSEYQQITTAWRRHSGTLFPQRNESDVVGHALRELRERTVPKRNWFGEIPMPVRVAALATAAFIVLASVLLRFPDSRFDSGTPISVAPAGTLRDGQETMREGVRMLDPLRGSEHVHRDALSGTPNPEKPAAETPRRKPAAPATD